MADRDLLSEDFEFKHENASAVNTSTRGKLRDEVTNVDSQSLSAIDDAMNSLAGNNDAVVHIDAVFDSNDNLVQLKFRKNKTVPEVLLKIFSLIAHFHSRLTAIYIDRGLNQSSLYQAKKLVNVANITEAILDNTVLSEANYYILLDEYTTIKYLSLARCKLNDDAVEMIAAQLNSPSKASKTLSILNLSTNRITDRGAKYLGDVLRANRKITYLNLAGNMITDVGADSILSSLMPFPLTADEISQKKARKFIYMKEKKRFIQDTIERMRNDYEKKNVGKRKSLKQTLVSSKKSKASVFSLENDRSVCGFETIWLEKAETAADEVIGPFQDAFNDENTVARNDGLYCFGNNIMCYLNLAYNNVSYFIVKKLLQVIKTQREMPRSPKGLVNINIEGNNLPVSCEELSDIDVLIEYGLSRFCNISMTKKKVIRK